MKLTTTLLPLFLSSFAAAKSLSFFGSEQKVLDDDLSVPGANPLKFCQKTDNYSLTISNVDLTPNPPSPSAYPFSLSFYVHADARIGGRCLVSKQRATLPRRLKMALTSTCLSSTA